MIEKIRAAFEAKFPRPKGAVVDADGFYSGAEWVSFYNARWEGWQAAHAAAEHPGTVKVCRELLAGLISQDHDTRIQAERSLYAILAGGEA